MRRQIIQLLASVVVGAGAITATGSVSMQPAAAANGDVDPAWNDGKPLYPADLGFQSITSFVVDQTGATYIIGTEPTNGWVGGLVTKLDPTGRRDETFGTRSIFYDGFPLLRITGAALQPNSELVISGEASGSRWVVAQPATYNLVDLSAAVGGPLDTNSPVTIVPLADGSMVLGANVYDANFRGHVAIVRLHADLSFDKSFGTGGFLLDPIPPPPNEFDPAPVVIHPDSLGRLLVSVQRPFGHPVVFRLTSTGAADASFATAGILDEADPGYYPYGCGTDFALDAHDRIVTVCAHDPLHGNAALSRYRPDGTLDTTFGDGGTARVTPSAGSTWSAGTMVTAQGDDLIVGGRTRDSATLGAPTDYAIWRFTADGRLDRSFGTNAGVIRGNEGTSDAARSVSPAADGDLTVLVDTNADAGGLGQGVLIRFKPGTAHTVPPMMLLDAPVRVLDTRIGLPGGALKVLGGHVLTLPIAGQHGIDSDASGVVLNVTVTEPEAPGYLTVYPCGQPPPVASNINYVRGQTIANLVISRLGAEGAICIFSSQTTHVVADLTGDESASADVHPLPAPRRLIDTRIALGWILPAKIGSPVLLGLSTPTLSLSQIPSSTWVNEVVLDVTITQPDHPGYLTVYQCDTSVPLASNLNFAAGQTISNLVAVRLSQASRTGAAICFHSSTTTHLVVDLEATIDVGAADITLAQPTRVLDTRIGTGAAAGRTTANVPLELKISPPSIGADAFAVGINVTVTEPEAAGYLTVYPCGQPTPLASNLNFVAGDTVPNYVIARLGEGSKICIVSSTPTHVVADLTEFFTPVE